MGDFDFEPLSGLISPEDVVSGARNCKLVGEANRLLADRVEEVVSSGRFPLILGGDHSIAMGSPAGVLRVRPETGVLWIDAHADINTPETSESGNMHGMPIGFMMEGIAPDHSKLPVLEWLVNGPRLSWDSLVYVGLRDVDKAERQTIRELGIKAYTMHAIDRYGIDHVMEMALRHLLKDNPRRPLHMSYDIDVVDPFLAPATGTTVRGGLSFREAHYVAEAAAASGNLASAEIVEVNPTMVGADETVDLGLQLVASIMGKSIL